MLTRSIVFLLSALAVTTAQAAAGDPVLRAFGIEAYALGQPDAFYVGRDRFNNGDTLSGMVYTGAGGATTPGTYRPFTFPAGAEASGPATDFLGTLYGVGSLTFSAAGATLSNSNLTPAGYDSYYYNLATQFVDPRAGNAPAGAAFQGLLQNSNGFNLFTLWNFSIPVAGANYAMRVQGGSAPGTTAYSDQLELRVATNLAGVTSVDLTRGSFDGINTFSRTVLASASLSSAYSGNLSDVDFIELILDRAPPSNGGNAPVLASFQLLDALADSNGDLLRLGQRVVLDAAPLIYNDSTIAQPNIRANFNVAISPVPEPSQYALLGFGLLTLTIAMKRRA